MIFLLIYLLSLFQLVIRGTCQSGSYTHDELWSVKLPRLFLNSFILLTNLLQQTVVSYSSGPSNLLHCDKLHSIHPGCTIYDFDISIRTPQNHVLPVIIWDEESHFISLQTELIPYLCSALITFSTYFLVLLLLLWNRVARFLSNSQGTDKAWLCGGIVQIFFSVSLLIFENSHSYWKR